MKRLYFVSGVPGSGKTVWLKKLQTLDGFKKGEYISRDEIRFSMISEGDEYFSKEKEVFSEFIRRIRNSKEDNLFIDATFLNEKSRNKVLDKLDLQNTEVYWFVFNVSLKWCLDNNRNRTGLEFVPESVIKRMYYQFQPPTYDELHKYTTIYTLSEDK